MSTDDYRNQHRQQQYRGPPQNRQHHPNQVNQQQQQSQQGNWNRPQNRQQRPRSRPSGEGVQPPAGGFRRNPPASQMNTSGGKPKNTLKFENDYDFEQANTKFEELRSQFEKVHFIRLHST